MPNKQNSPVYFEWWNDEGGPKLHFKLVIDGFAIAQCKKTDFERALYAECEKSTMIADKLLALESIVRNIEKEVMGK